MLHLHLLPLDQRFWEYKSRKSSFGLQRKVMSAPPRAQIDLINFNKRKINLASKKCLATGGFCTTLDFDVGDQGSHPAPHAWLNWSYCAKAFLCLCASDSCGQMHYVFRLSDGGFLMNVASLEHLDRIHYIWLRQGLNEQSLDRHAYQLFPWNLLLFSIV